MFIPTVTELRPSLDAVCRDPFLGDRSEPPEPTSPATLPDPHRRSQRALVEAALLRMPARHGVRSADS